MGKVNSIHFVGIKGVGMTPLAIIAKEAGISITGSDVAEDFITDVPLKKVGITPSVGFDPSHVGEVEMVITTNAHGGYDNPEVVEAKRRAIPVLTKGEAVGAFMKGELLGTHYQGVSVAGSHGKTTTTAMIATILKEAGKDPGYLIGTSEIPSLGGMPGHFGQGQFFIAEADEYANEPHYDPSAQFLHQHPRVALFTNIEHDHPDIYPTITDVRKAFLKFAEQLPEHGLLIICGDGEQAKQLLQASTGTVRTYGLSPLNDYFLKNVSGQSGNTTFTVEGKEVSLGEFTLNVMGEHNALNALGAALVCLELGLSLDEIKSGLTAFAGTKRRLEYVGRLASGAVVYDDYAHHPTEISSSLKALRKHFPDKQIVCIFQPHTYSRTKELFSEFAVSFSAADSVILMDIFASAREAPDGSVSSAKLASEMKKHQEHVSHLGTKEDVVEYIEANHFDDDTVLLTMGAGDVYKILHDLPMKDRNDEFSE